MGAWVQSIKTTLEKSQGSAARALDRLPTVVQKQLIKRLQYPYKFPQLDPFIQCLMALQVKQGKVGFIAENYHQSRTAFENNIKSLATKPTAIESVEDLRLPLMSGTVFARHYHPAPQKKLPCIVLYHGGGFIVGSLETHDEFCRLLAKYARAQVISVDYPLAPEVSPHQLIQVCEDALAWVYQNRRQLKILKGRIAVAGDSAGGNIATVVAQRAKSKAYAPHAQLLVYPVVDFKSRHPSFFAYKDGLVLTGQDVDVVEALYAQQHDIALDDPIISPTYGKLEHLAPAFIITAGHDILHDEASIYSHKLLQQGVSVHYQEYKDQTHGFVNLTPISKRAKNYVIEISKNFRKFWDKQH